jgi:hypothetical protein
MTTMTFTLTREVFEKCRRDLAAEGVQLVGDSGEMGRLGVKASFTFVEPTLTITILKSGFFSSQYIQSKIDYWFSQEGVQGE